MQEGARVRIHKSKICVAALVAAALLASVLVLKPRYDRFVAEDYRETCYDAMYWIGIWYHAAIREEKAAGRSEKDMDYEDLLRQVIAAHYVINVDDQLKSENFCRAGGHVQMSLAADTHRLSIACDEPGHQDYSDEMITEDFLDGLQNISSGVDVAP